MGPTSTTLPDSIEIAVNTPLKLENPFCCHVSSPDTSVLRISSVDAALSSIFLMAASSNVSSVLTTFFILETVLL